LPDLKKLLETDSSGIWLLGDYQLLADDNPFYSQSLKRFIRTFINEPDYVGLDNQTFAVKLR
jgi:hypothetical protein